MGEFHPSHNGKVLWRVLGTVTECIMLQRTKLERNLLKRAPANPLLT